MILLAKPLRPRFKKQLQVLDICKKAHMQVNTEKTVIVIFNIKWAFEEPNFDGHGTPLKVEDSTCYLGMLFFASQKFHQARQERSKLQSRCHILYNHAPLYGTHNLQPSTYI